MNARADGTTQPAFDDSKCEVCHSPGGSASVGSELFHANNSKTCSECHSFHNPERISVNADTMLLTLATTATPICETCHSTHTILPEVSPGHREASRLIHSQRDSKIIENPSEYCLICHCSDRVTTGDFPLAAQASRFHVSASHGFGIELRSGYHKPNSNMKIQDEIPPHIKLIDGKIECYTCHSLVSEEEFELVQTISDGLCISCHDMRDNSTLVFDSDLTQ